MHNFFVKDKKLRAGLPALLVSGLFLMALNPVWGLSGDEILEKMETTLAAPEDAENRAQMVLANSDGSQQEKRTLKLWSAGKDKRVIKFIEPAGIAGIGLLVLGDNEMYLYLPAQNKIRRIEGGSKNDDFQGTDFSYNELGSYEYKKDYSAELTAQDETTYTLTLARKEGSERVYEKIIMLVEKSNFVPRQIELFEKNSLKKRLTIAEVKKIDGYFIPSRIRMENLVKKHYTEVTLSDITLDQKLESRDIFSKRFLKLKVR